MRAQLVHREHHPADEVQLCTLLSVKTGGCPEDCAYCPQSSHYDTGLERERMLKPPEVLEAAARAKAAGATRFCMGAAWREVKDGPAFDDVLEMVRGVRALGMEACCTLGMLDRRRRRSGSPRPGSPPTTTTSTPRATFYGRIITTRTYDDRLRTLGDVRKAGITVCSGGIIGMGESIDDRCAMLRDAGQPRPAAGERADQHAGRRSRARRSPIAPPVDPLELVRMIATARILMPRARVRLSAGRLSLSREAQVLCFLAGANSIFYGEKLLTTGNPDVERRPQPAARRGPARAPRHLEGGAE